MTNKKYHEQANKALCYFINILGYAKEEIESNHALFSDVPNFLYTLKAHLMNKTKLTRVHNDTDSSNVECNNKETCDEEEKKRINEVKQTLLARLPQDEYNKLVKN